MKIGFFAWLTTPKRSGSFRSELESLFLSITRIFWADRMWMTHYSWPSCSVDGACSTLTVPSAEVYDSPKRGVQDRALNCIWWWDSWYGFPKSPDLESHHQMQFINLCWTPLFGESYISNVLRRNKLKSYRSCKVLTLTRNIMRSLPLHWYYSHGAPWILGMTVSLL